MQISKEEKETLVIRLAKEGKATRELAKEAHIYLKDIGKIIRKVAVDDDGPIEKEEEGEDIKICIFS